MDASRLHQREVPIGSRSVDYFEPEGPLIGDLLELFEQRTKELLSRGRRDIRVGFGSVTLLDSSAVALLVKINARLMRNHKRLVIDYQGNKMIRNLFVINKLDHVLGNADDDDPEAWTAGKSAPLIPPLQRGAPGNENVPDRRPEDADE